MKHIILILALLCSATAFAANPVVIDFAQEKWADWGKTKGADATQEAGVATIDGTDWDSKIHKRIRLQPEQTYELSATGRGKAAVRIHAAWEKVLAQLPITGNTFRTGSVKFKTPAGQSTYILCVQVNAEKGRAEMKQIVLTPVADESTEVKYPADSLSGIVFHETFPDAAAAEKISNADFVPGGGPGGINCIRLTDGAGEMEIDTNLLRGRLVTVEAMVKGGDLKGGTLKIIPAYLQGPGEYYPPARADKGSFDWRKFGYSIRIPDYAGKLKLHFGHAAGGGTAEYADVKLSLAPLPEMATHRNSAPMQTSPRYRGAMIGSFRGEEESSIREFGEVWRGNLVRLQFSGGSKENTPEKYRQWGEKQMDALDRKLEHFEKYGIKVVIDLHSGPGVMNEILQNVGVWSSEAQDMIVDLWREIARRYKGNPNIYGYDILNEPLEVAYVYREGGALDWNRLAERIGKAIREIDPDTPVIVSSAIGGNAAGFAALRPIDIPNVIYTVHLYLPHGYTHQGVNGAKMIGSYPGVSCDGRKWDKALLRQSLEPVVRFQKQYNVPIFVGEFGVARWAPGAEQYLTDCIDLFEEYGWDWAYHAYREWPGWSAEHSDDPADTKRHENTPRKALLLRYMQRNHQ